VRRERFRDGIERGSEFSITSKRAAPKVATRSQISEPIEPPPPVTITALPFTSASSLM
jgi:hypothetical protein